MYVDRYDAPASQRALLRWSLWEAADKRCYICGDPTQFTETQIDHVIPKSTPKNEFGALWRMHSRGMPDLGVHHIANLRACCSDCNSARVKGAKRFSAALLDLVLEKSASLIAAAHREQDRIRKSGEIGEAIIRVASADTPEAHDLLWDLDLSQAIAASLHEASRRVVTMTQLQVPIYSADYRVELQAEGQVRRLLSGWQIVTGLSLGALVRGVVECAVDEFDRQLAYRVERSSNGLLHGANAGTADWRGAEFRVAIDEVSIDTEKAVCVCTISVEETVTLMSSAQSSDGSELVDAQWDLAIEGSIQVQASTQVGHVPRTDPRIDDLEVMDSDISVDTL